MRLLIAFVISLRCFAALSVAVTSANQTQAVLQERGFSGTCTIEVSKSPTYSPLIPDVNSLLYSGSNTDTGRLDTISWGDSTRIVTLGHQISDRALSVYTTYYWRVSGCGGTATGTFKTPTLSGGTNRTEATPFDATKWGNLGMPSFDWTTIKTYTDPNTGVLLTPMVTTTTTWRTGGGGFGPQSASRAFTDYDGGSGWTNPGGVLLGASTNASTTNTNPIDVYINLDNTTAGGLDPLPYAVERTLEDVGVVIWGSGTGATSADRTVDLCIITNPAGGCASNIISVPLGTGSVVAIPAPGSTDPDAPWPAAFPSVPFFGWTGSGINPVIRMENRGTFGSATVAGSTLTIGADPATRFNNISSALLPGNKIYVAGSSCTNSLCTVAAIPSSGASVTLSETPGDGATTYHTYGWGIRIAKHTATGTVTVGAKIKLAGSNNPIGTQSIGDKCNYLSVTSGDGKIGNICSLTGASAGANYVAFVAQDGTVRMLMALPKNISFDSTHGNIWYAGPISNSDNGFTFKKYVYSGDYQTDLLPNNYACSPDGGCPPFNPVEIAITDMMPHSSSADLGQQIAAKQGVSIPVYSYSLYGQWDQSNFGNIQYYGTSNTYAAFGNLYAGQSQSPGGGGPGWAAIVDFSVFPAQVVNLIHTLDGTGNALSRWGGLHSLQGMDANPNTFLISANTLRSNSTTTLNGGPFQATVLRVLAADGTTWKTDTSLPWPPDTTYDGACPVGTVLYSTCVTFLLPQGGVCNVFPTVAMKTNFPCPWNASYSQYPFIQAGDNSVDISGSHANDLAAEHFHILSATPVTIGGLGPVLKIVAARNGTYFYCSINPWHTLGTNPWVAPQTTAQVTHADGWGLTMVPGSKNVCGDSTLLFDAVAGNSQEVPLTGHFTLGINGSNLNYVTATNAFFDTPFAGLSTIPITTMTVYDAAFGGNPSRIGTTNGPQSYTSNEQLAAGPPGFSWSMDANALVAFAPEVLSQGPSRALSHVTGDVWKLEDFPTAVALDKTGYKTQPFNGWAGKWSFHDVSGLTPNIIDSSPFGLCFAYNAGECHSGSTLFDTYVNLPSAYDWIIGSDHFCSASVTFVSLPCLLVGDNAPVDGFRRFSVSRNDPNGATSQWVTNGWASVGRHYPYTHSTVMPSGDRIMLMGDNIVDGFSSVGFTVSIPPFVTRSDPANNFKSFTVKLPAGLSNAEVEFGYSKNGLPAQMYCTPRAEICKTSTNVTPFAFLSESSTPASCSAGCTISVPVVAPNLVYYRVRRSADGTTWVNQEIQAIALQ